MNAEVSATAPGQGETFDRDALFRLLARPEFRERIPVGVAVREDCRRRFIEVMARAREMYLASLPVHFDRWQEAECLVFYDAELWRMYQMRTAGVAS